MARPLGSAYVPQPLPAAKEEFDPSFNRAMRRQIEMNLQDISVQIARLYQLVPIIRGVETREIPVGSTTFDLTIPAANEGDFAFLSLAENDPDLTATARIPREGVVEITVANAGGAPVEVNVAYQVLRGGVNELTTRVLT